MPDSKRILFTAALCKDKRGAAVSHQRETLMAEHLAYVEKIVDQILVAGPMFDQDNKTIIGSILIYKTAEKEEAQQLLENDPYYSAGIWETIEFETFRGALGSAVGGISY
ncbi:YciI family protein [Temperatibacter marinus]|uniref:YciI family protein n=1 Tax=Temperatibacter marinus TaxID=1456591 RepID=A0AA52HA12_9PROT|nr:YciI family protein [Temperatibacter marinus]WND03489.1 YciI family protein [Temperatibacter marinus]